MSGYGEITAQVGHAGVVEETETLRRIDGGDGSGTASVGSSFDNGCVDCHDFYEIHV